MLKVLKKPFFWVTLICIVVGCMVPPSIPYLVILLVLYYFVIIRKEKRSINKHKKNQNYKSNVTQSKADNKNQKKSS